MLQMGTWEQATQAGGSPVRLLLLVFLHSWGPDDDGKTVDGPHQLGKVTAMQKDLGEPGSLFLHCPAVILSVRLQDVANSPFWKRVGWVSLWKHGETMINVACGLCRTPHLRAKAHPSSPALLASALLTSTPCPALLYKFFLLEGDEAGGRFFSGSSSGSLSSPGCIATRGDRRP